MTTAAPPDPGTTECPRCGAAVAGDQDWCLSCGDAARTRLVPTPNWRLPLLLAATVGALALLAILLAFVQLTRDPAPVTTTTTAPATTAPTATAAPPPVATTPTATVAPPPSGTTPTTSVPGTTIPAPGATTTTP